MREALLSFFFIFLAALPGRTTFILILLAASVRPWRLLLGALPAFAIQCGLAVMAGQALKDLPQAYIRCAAGLLFIYFAKKFWLESQQKADLSKDRPKRSVSSIFLLFFMAELGDVSQLAVAARATQSDSPFGVLAGSVLAMSTIAVISTFAGRWLGSVAKPTSLQKMAALLFLLLGSYLLISGGISLMTSKT